MFSKILSALGVAPKTLPQATETLGEAKNTLDSVAALFTAAGLNLEQMLAAGPDALKAHLESIDNTEELAAALQENERIEAELAADHATIEALNANLAGHTEILTMIGIPAPSALSDPTKIKTAFETHVSKQTTLALAKTGHPPAHVPAAEPTASAPTSDADLAKEYQAMRAGPERLAFYSQHEVALNRFAKSLRKPE